MMINFCFCIFSSVFFGGGGCVLFVFCLWSGKQGKAIFFVFWVWCIECVRVYVCTMFWSFDCVWFVVLYYKKIVYVCVHIVCEWICDDSLVLAIMIWRLTETSLSFYLFLFCYFVIVLGDTHILKLELLVLVGLGIARFGGCCSFKW